MTAFDRIERRLPEILDDLGAPNTPDYFDDMLRMTARTRQRPAWSAPERWLPMGVIARPLPFRPVPWRLFAIAAAILILAAAALLYVGSARRLPPPFGPARNGVIVYGTADYDIASLDPASGRVTTILALPTQEQFPAFSLDGTRLIFARGATDTSETDFVAAADGSNAKQLVSGPAIKWFDESGSGDRALVSRIVGTGVVQSMVDMTTGKETPLNVDPALGITMGMFRPSHDQVIYAHVPDNGYHGMAAYIAHGDGTGPLDKLALSPDAINDPSFSPDGSKLVYTTWGEGVDGQGRTHIFDIDARTDRTLMSRGSAGSIELFPQFSPDGKRVSFFRWGDAGVQAVIVPLDGNGPDVPIGPIKPSQGGNAQLLWSPDGTQVITSYEADGSVWLLPIDGTAGRQLDGLLWDRGISWQRLAQ